MKQGIKSGFTLIELLVVIAIIAVLASMLVPAVQSALTRGKIAYCASNLRQMGIATYAYANDHRGKVPPLTDGSTSTPYKIDRIHFSRNWRYQNTFFSQGILYRDGYADNGRMFYCPTQTQFYFSYPAYANPKFPTGSAGDGNFTGGPDLIRSGYMYNPMVNVDPRSRRVVNPPTQKIQVLAEVTYPLTTILSADTFEPPYLASRHPGPAWNVGMADGHVEEIKSPSAVQIQLRRETDFNPGDNFNTYAKFLDELLDSR